MRQVDGHLGHEDVVGPDGDARKAGDPARVAAHGLDDHDPPVALGRGAQAIDGFGHDVDGRVEPERKIGHHQVIVDRLGNADHGDAEVIMKADRHAQGIVAADHDQGVQLQPSEVLAQRGEVGLGVAIGVGPRRPENAAPLGDDAVGRRRSSGGRSCSEPARASLRGCRGTSLPRWRAVARRRGSRRSSPGSHRRR